MSWLTIATSALAVFTLGCSAQTPDPEATFGTAVQEAVFAALVDRGLLDKRPRSSQRVPRAHLAVTRRAGCSR